MEYILNSHYVKIKKCCASCQHKKIRDQRMRVCGAGKGIVRHYETCELYTMDPALDNAGKGGGDVKKKQYIYYVYENADNKTDDGMRVSIDSLRKEYEDKFGSRILF